MVLQSGTANTYEGPAGSASPAGWAVWGGCDSPSVFSCHAHSHAPTLTLVLPFGAAQRDRLYPQNGAMLSTAEVWGKD